MVASNLEPLIQSNYMSFEKWKKKKPGLRRKMSHT